MLYYCSYFHFPFKIIVLFLFVIHLFWSPIIIIILCSFFHSYWCKHKTPPKTFKDYLYRLMFHFIRWFIFVLVSLLFLYIISSLISYIGSYFLNKNKDDEENNNENIIENKVKDEINIEEQEIKQ